MFYRWLAYRTFRMQTMRNWEHSLGEQVQKSVQNCVISVQKKLDPQLRRGTAPPHTLPFALLTTPPLFSKLRRHWWFRSVRWCLAVGLACGDQGRLTGNGSALEVVFHDDALYKSTTLLLLRRGPPSGGVECKGVKKSRFLTNISLSSWKWYKIEP